MYVDGQGWVRNDMDGFVVRCMGSYGWGWVRMDRDEHRWGVYDHGYGMCT